MSRSVAGIIGVLHITRQLLEEIDSWSQAPGTGLATGAVEGAKYDYAPAPTVCEPERGGGTAVRLLVARNGGRILYALDKYQRVR